MGAEIDSVCVFCGSSMGTAARYENRAAALGALLARRGIHVIYGGAHVGTMGVLADAALAEGGAVTGVIPETMVERELAHTGLTELHIVAGMHERKALMAELSDAFLALPGGIGTLEEVFEVWTWSQIGLHTKPIGLLDVAGFYQPLVRMVDHMIDEGFLRAEHRDTIAVHSDAAGLLDAFTGHIVPADKWGA